MIRDYGPLIKWSFFQLLVPFTNFVSWLLVLHFKILKFPNLILLLIHHFFKKGHKIFVGFLAFALTEVVTEEGFAALLEIYFFHL